MAADIIRRVYQLIEQSPKGFIRKTSNELPSKKKGRQCSLGTIDTLLLAMVAHENCCIGFIDTSKVLDCSHEGKSVSKISI